VFTLHLFCLDVITELAVLCERKHVQWIIVNAGACNSMTSISPCRYR